MSGFKEDPAAIATVPIRYDGGMTDSHRIDMADLAEALAGWNRILVVCGNFAATNRVVRHVDAADVRAVLAVPEAGCVTLTGMVAWLNANPLLTTIAGGLVVSLVGWAFSAASGRKDEMRHLRAIAEQALRQAGTRDEVVLGRLMDTLDRLIGGLRPAVRQAVKPVGRSATSLTIAGEGVPPVVIGEAEAEAIRADVPLEVGAQQEFSVSITELDVETGTCRVSFAGGEGRVSGRITDPVLTQPNNPYALALASRQPLSVLAKPTLRDGELERLFISDTAPCAPGA
ncbi:hypothetical protein [Falsiroseomonas sp. E2-1-a20]|uniref:DUF7946 domain-containing protein n=1 Tax=Falsiroseomonas sp. E2-1-a20 TaxID=3239300 RepID=UPI003F2AB494